MTAGRWRSLCVLLPCSAVDGTDDTRTDDLPYWVPLHRVYRLGSARFAVLERSFPTLEDAWRASRDELIAAGLDASTATAVMRAHEEIDPAAELERLAASGVRPIARFDLIPPTRSGCVRSTMRRR